MKKYPLSYFTPPLILSPTTQLSPTLAHSHQSSSNEARSEVRLRKERRKKKEGWNEEDQEVPTGDEGAEAGGEGSASATRTVLVPWRYADGHLRQVRRNAGQSAAFDRIIGAVECTDPNAQRLFRLKGEGGTGEWSG